MYSSKNNETTFNQPPSYDDLLLEYQKQQKTNPASIYYERKLVRPKLYIFRVLAYCLITLIISFLISVGVYFISNNILLSIIIGLVAIVLTCVIFAKRIIIWFVKVYQRFAPTKRRECCRFAPSCSEYMILSLQKYGAIKGLKKGFNRLGRCRPPNGGIDYP